METKFSIEINYLGHQSDHITHEKFRLFQEYDADPENARLLLILLRRRAVELISDGNKLVEVKVITKNNTYLNMNNDIIILILVCIL